MDFLVLTGLSGAGKSHAAHVLEDVGYYCIDNLPPHMVLDFYHHCKEKDGKYAVVMDTRAILEFGCLDAISECIKQLKSDSNSVKILYMDASDEILVRRFKESRRRHPLLECEKISTIEDAISAERNILSVVRLSADFVLDTSRLSNADLKSHIFSILSVSKSQQISIAVYSFGFKYGVPSDADLMFDVRCLPNPFYIDSLKHQTGLDDDVYNYVFSFAQSNGLFEHIKDLIDFSLPLYISEGKSRLAISFGCTGGHHRSVAFAKRLALHLSQQGQMVILTHKDISR